MGVISRWCSGTKVIVLSGVWSSLSTTTALLGKTVASSAVAASLVGNSRKDVVESVAEGHNSHAPFRMYCVADNIARAGGNRDLGLSQWGSGFGDWL